MAKEEESGELLRYLKKMSSASTTPTLKTGELQDSLYNLQKAVNPVELAFKAIPGVGNAMYTSLSNANIVFQDLSKAGGGFRGDLIGLSTAAANSRLSLTEFASVLKENNEVFIGLGGTATRGAEAFAKLSKAFMDDRSTDNLRLLGYSAKDLNELMAIQAVTLRGNFRDETERNKVATENAAKLGQEMDLMARLTGKSREQQMEQMKKAQADMQFEAAIRLKTQGMSAEEAAKFEANARSQYRDAELRGQGQMFKEIFATGQIMSKEAATQAALNQEQASATRKQAQISADASIDSSKREQEATAAGREARAAATADMNNTAKLQLMTLGDAGGVATKTLNQSAAAQMSYTRGLEAIAKEQGLDLKNREDLAKAQKIQEERALQEAKGRDDSGKSVNELNKSMILFEARAKDVSAALNESLLQPLRNLDGPFKQFNTMLSEAGSNFGGTNKNVRAAIADTTQAAREGKPLGEVGGLGGDVLKGLHVGANLIEQGTKKGAEYIEKAGDFFGNVTKDGVGGLINNLSKEVGQVAPAIKEGAEKAKETLEGPLKLIHQYIIEPLAKSAAQQVPKRQGGSLEMTGKLFENWGQGTLVELHGLEGVMKPEEMGNIAKGMSNQGAAKAIDQLKNQIAGVKPSEQSKNVNLDLSSISKDITTTISSPTPKTPQTVETKVPSTPLKVEVVNFPKSSDFKKEEAKSVTETKKEEAKPVTETKKEEAKTAEPKTPTQASVRAVDNKIDAEPKTPTQASVRAVDNLIEKPKIDWKSAVGEFGEEMKLPFGSMIDEFGSNFDKVIADVNQGLGNVNVDKFKVNLESINKDLVSALPTIEVSKQQEEFKSKFTDSQKKFIDDYQGMSRDNQEFMTFALKRQHGIDAEIIEKHDAIIADLQKKKNERELTEEEEARLAESEMISAGAKEDYAKRQQQLDIIKNIQTLSDELDLERKQEALQKSNDIVLKAADSLMLEVNDIASDIEEAMTAVDVPPIQIEDVVAQARDNLMLEANEIAEDIEDIAKAIPFATTSMADMTMAADEISASMSDMIPTDSIIAARDAMMLEANEIAEDIAGQMAAVDIPPINVEDVLKQAHENMMLEANEIAEDIQEALPVDPVRQLSDNLVLEANEMAEDINENFSSMIDDAAYSTGPGNASIAGLDFIAEDIKKALPVEEFGGLAEAIEQQKNIEKNTSGMDVQAEDGTVSQGVKINPETGERYYTDLPKETKSSINEQVQTTNPFFNEKGDLDLNSIHLPGMKKYGADLKSQTQNLTNKDENQSDAETARLKRQSEPKKESEKLEPEKTESKKEPRSKEATLDDVVKQLSSLNKNMNTLIDQNQKMLGDQIKATKANNKNNFVGVY